MQFRTIIRTLYLAGVASLAPLSAAHTETRDLRISRIETLDRGSLSEGLSLDPTIDVVQGVCGEEPDEQPEAFYDTLLRVHFVNRLNQEVRVRSFRYLVPDGVSSQPFASASLGPSSAPGLPASEEESILFLFIKASQGQKIFLRSGVSIPSTLGVQNVRVIVKARSASGRRLIARERVAMSFDDYDRCTQ